MKIVDLLKKENICLNASPKSKSQVLRLDNAPILRIG